MKGQSKAQQQQKIVHTKKKIRATNVRICFTYVNEKTTAASKKNNNDMSLSIKQHKKNEIYTSVH